MTHRNIAVEEMRLRATPGAILEKAIREAMVLALNEDRDVVLVHNDREYEICPATLIDSVHPKVRP